MGNKTLCCSSQTQFSQHNMKTRGPQSITITSFMGCNVCLSHGQLFQEDVDTVVVVVNTKLKLGPQTQNYIKKNGGPQVLNELKHVLLDEGGKLELGRVVYTHAGDLDYEYIFYAVLPSCCDSSMLQPRCSLLIDNCDYQLSGSYEQNLRIQDCVNIYTEKLGDSVQTHERQNIYECMINCLQKAAELGIKSIAFPVLEPSIVHISKSKIVSTMLFAVKQFLREYNRNKLEDIRICSNVQDIQTVNLFKYYINQILNDQSETTIEHRPPRHLTADMIKKNEQPSFDSQDNHNQNINVDEIMKFCHNFKTDIHNKHKSSF